MTISDIVWNPNKIGSLVGYATVTIDDSLVLTGIKVLKGNNGYYLGMPAKQGKDDKWYDYFFPKTKKFREQLTQEILEKAGLIDADGGTLSQEEEEEDLPF